MREQANWGCLAALALILAFDVAVVAIAVAIAKLVWRAL